MNEFKKCIIGLLCVGLLVLCLLFCPEASFFLFGIIIIAIGVYVHVNARNSEHEKTAIILYAFGVMELIGAIIVVISTR